MTDRPGSPITRQISEWEPNEVDVEVMRILRNAGCKDVAVWDRNVHDGTLRAIRSCDPPNHLWHLSVSHTRQGKRPNRKARYPTWDELADARYELLPGNINVVMYLPPEEDFVDVHETCFHLYEAPPEHIPAEMRPESKEERMALVNVIHEEAADI